MQRGGHLDVVTMEQLGARGDGAHPPQERWASRSHCPPVSDVDGYQVF